ncbi:hypothetical protein FLBR109950_09970 [Flavobacterium branchiophilum]|uniref:Uncharacterized protein n=1 Tax=Flavobacterium branchiophilum (strain FL-15) TaxID=1034807 RepID=G2Z0B2_FLABF|nr:hypothetical protein [Flavobacterium branchiophilum]CCB70878.1 Hypothetical protein FBFL15_2930 [Flavobacterium branchiophilum FL-15]
MTNNNRKFFVELVLLTVIIFFVFISTWYKDSFFDSDGIRIFSMVAFGIAVDLCIYAYKNNLK